MDFCYYLEHFCFRLNKLDGAVNELYSKCALFQYKMEIPPLTLKAQELFSWKQTVRSNEYSLT